MSTRKGTPMRFTFHATFISATGMHILTVYDTQTNLVFSFVSETPSGLYTEANRFASDLQAELSPKI